MSAVLVLSVLGLLLQGLYLLDYFTSGNLYLESLLLSVLTPAFSLLGTVVLIVWAAKLSDHLLILATKLNLNNCLAKTLTASAEGYCLYMIIDISVIENLAINCC